MLPLLFKLLNLYLLQIYFEKPFNLDTPFHHTKFCSRTVAKRCIVEIITKETNTYSKPAIHTLRIKSKIC